MVNRTAAESKNHYIKKMGPELGSQFAALWQEVASLHMKWEEYVGLFGTSPERIDVLNQAAPKFFRMLQDALFEDTLLHITRLTDPTRTGGKENLTVRRLPELVADVDVKKALTEGVDAAVTASEFARKWRNRRIAHHDLDLAIKEPARELEPASRKQVNEALSALATVLNIADARFAGSGTYFKVGYGPGGSISLLHTLDDGLRAAAKREERLSRGIFDPEDQPRAL